jgi:hypothetical protein
MTGLVKADLDSTDPREEACDTKRLLRTHGEYLTSPIGRHPSTSFIVQFQRTKKNTSWSFN